MERYCKNCAAPLDNDSKFCTDCGREVDSENKSDITFKAVLLVLVGIVVLIMLAGFFSEDIVEPAFEEYDFGYCSMLVPTGSSFEEYDRADRGDELNNITGTGIATTGDNTLISNATLNNVNGTAIQIEGNNPTVNNVSSTNTTGTLMDISGDNITLTNVNSTDNSTIALDGKVNKTENITGATIIPSIRATSVVKGNDVIITATVSATEGDVTVQFQDKNYTAPLTDGKAEITISNVNYGTYENMSVSYEGNTLYQNVSANTSFTSKTAITENKDVTIDYLSGYKYTVRIIHADGTYAAGVTVKMTVNGKTYNVKTDKNGYAKLLIELKPKSYKITTQYMNIKKTNKITVKSTILIVKKTVKVKKTSKKFVLKAKLKWSNGKPIKGKVIRFKFKGKIYKAKTNSKGIAKVTIKKSIIKKIKKGKTYRFRASYEKEYKYGKVKVKK